MILLKTVNVNENVETLIKKYEKRLNFQCIKCPKCDCNELNSHGTYTRNVIYFENNKKYETTIKIKRLICDNCNKTHAIIPDFLVPYKQHTFKFIVKVLNERVNNKCTTSKIENSFEIGRQLLLFWMKSFEKFKSKIYVLYNLFDICLIIKKILKEIQFIRYEFYIKNKEILLMERNDAIYNYLST